MPRIERAKQFAPFNALKGLQKALREKEFEHDKIAKKEISEEYKILISQELKEINKNSIVEIMYYNNGYYNVLKGKVIVDITNKVVFIDNIIVKFDDIYKIHIINK